MVQAAPPELVALARRHLSGLEGVSFAPKIPAAKQAGVRAVHQGHLPATEPLLAVYDDTLFGTGEEGYLITPERLCWKNFLEHPREIAWSELDPASVVRDGGRVRIGGSGGIAATGDLAVGTVGLIVAMVERFVPADASPYRKSPRETHVAGEAPLSRLTTLGRRQLGEFDNVFYHPAIPPPKLRNARTVHAAHLAPDETVAVLYDDTLFGSARDGFLLTPRRLCWKNFSGAVSALEWSAIAPEQVAANGNLVHVMDLTVNVTTRTPFAARFAELVTALAVEVRGDRRA
jgi:hypothetical protein